MPMIEPGLQRRELILCLSGALTFGIGGNAAAAAASPASLSHDASRMAGEISHAALAASNRVVSSCADDGGAGTLRTVVSGAIAGDTIDLTGLPGADPTCVTSTITLSAGALTLGVSLTLKGPPDALLTIAGNGTSTVVGSLQPFEIDDLTISHGRGGAKAGCIYAKGGVTLRHSNVADCIVTGSAKYANGIAMGGGIYGSSVALLDGSRVQDSLAQGVKTQFSDKYPGLGGGVFAKSQFTCTDSTISGNTATFAAGGVFSYGSPTLTRCTIDSNTGGGIISVTTAGTLTVNQSTISGNSPVGIQSQSALSISNSTVAFNTTTSDRASGIYATQNVVAQSTIVASNYAAASTHADLQIGGGVVVSGADNLVMSTDASTGPGVITVSADPLLQPLADNGGPTQTHALAAQSPAIDKGNNAALYPTDQRGSGFAREVPAGSADIGAYEFRGDGIFYDGFQ